MGEGHHAGHVADCPDALAGAAAPVDGDAARVGLDAHVLKAQAGDLGPAARRDQELVGPQLAPVGELDHPIGSCP